MLTLSEWQETFNLLHTKTWRESPAWQNEPATLVQVKGLNILLRDGMIDQTRECKLHIVSKMVGRTVESTNHLTKIEAHVLITILKDVKASSETERFFQRMAEIGSTWPRLIIWKRPTSMNLYNLRRNLKIKIYHPPTTSQPNIFI